MCNVHNKFSTAKYRCGHLALLPDNFFYKIKKFVDLKLLEMLSCW
ncbi:hypothetical protein HMPREF9436_01233 [Faecalibacterium cf. prausnitzii KLE1255]|uniref:Uncharacterized protein n=1 Tax=Faecalibacterium cf. prausnitzii KLE1255 TaxID=748224 RepID=E2ZHU4_9FIRM|nr:hypothetical protein HMPREF9436_01233 [Faecalibacterium cf. prausnitzii KLE1255]